MAPSAVSVSREASTLSFRQSLPFDFKQFPLCSLSFPPQLLTTRQNCSSSFLSCVICSSSSSSSSFAMRSDPSRSQTRMAMISAHVAPTSGYEYDVFLSFRGPDTRRTFADVVYESLIDAGISVFRDNEELRVGESIGPDLERAIDNSRIYVPIFSKGYAESAWCLQELARMVKRRREPSGREIMPIFYDASPSDVRLRTGSYREALLKHERRYGEETVREWSEALTEVADLKGWDARNWRLGLLMKDIVRELSIKLKKR